MTARVMKYNPALLSTEELVRGFVVRETELELILRTLRDNCGPTNQHILVIGPRGSGKTTLVLRAAAETVRDPELAAAWHPVVFAEESYEVTSAGEFWLEALFHLAEQPGQEAWKPVYEELKREIDNDRLAERALGQLLDFADSRGKRLLLVVENLHMLLSETMSEDEGWKLRHTLLHEPRVMLLASATSRFRALSDPRLAMYEMLRIHELEPLNDRECNLVWAAVAGKGLEGERIRPVRILTGGNARLLSIIARFGAGRSFRELMDSLVQLIDDHTEYFKSHLDNLPTRERKVYLALAELWDHASAREAAAAARVTVNTASALLKRLEERGAVTVETRGRTHRYALAERMYNIYYLMRRRGRPADRVTAAVRFMACLYDTESMASLLVREADALPRDTCRDHYHAFAQTLRDANDPQLTGAVLAQTPEAFLQVLVERNLLDELLESGNAETRAPKQGQKTASATSLRTWRDQLQHVAELYKKKDFSACLAVCETMLDNVHPEPKVEATALFYKACVLFGQERHIEMIAVIEAYRELAAANPGAVPQASLAVAHSLLGRAQCGMKRFSQALDALDTALLLAPEDMMFPLFLEKARALTFARQYDEALAALRQAEQVAGQPGEFFSDLATGLFLLGEACLEQGLDSLAEDVWRHMEDARAGSDEAVVVYWHARLWLERLEACQGRLAPEEVVVSYGALLEVCKEHREDPDFHELFFAAAAGCAFFHLDYRKNSDDALALAESLHTFFPEVDECALHTEQKSPVFVACEAIRTLIRFRVAVKNGVQRKACALFAEGLRLSDQAGMSYVLAKLLGEFYILVLQWNEDADADDCSLLEAMDDLRPLVERHASTTEAPVFCAFRVFKGLLLSAQERSEEALSVLASTVDGSLEERSRRGVSDVLVKALVEMFRIHRAAGNKGRALDALRRAAGLLENVEVLQSLLLFHLLQAGVRPADTWKHLRSQADHARDNSGRLYRIAMACHLGGAVAHVREYTAWMEQAARLEPENPVRPAALARMLALCGRKEEALDTARNYLALILPQLETEPRKPVGDIHISAVELSIDTFVELAALGCGREARELLAASDAAVFLEPLVAGLDLDIGERSDAPQEILEVAKDVATRIQVEREVWKERSGDGKGAARVS